MHAIAGPPKRADRRQHAQGMGLWNQDRQGSDLDRTSHRSFTPLNPPKGLEA